MANIFILLQYDVRHSGAHVFGAWENREKALTNVDAAFDEWHSWYGGKRLVVPLHESLWRSSYCFVKLVSTEVSDG